MTNLLGRDALIREYVNGTFIERAVKESRCAFTQQASYCGIDTQVGPFEMESLSYSSAGNRCASIRGRDAVSPEQTVLIVSYFFAPSAEVGAKRFSFLAPELKRLGFDVQVIAGKIVSDEADDPSLPVISKVCRSSPSVSFPLRGRMLGRAGNWIARKLLAPVGPEIFWNGPAVRAAGSLGLKTKRGVVVGTIPPYSTAIAAARIARNLEWPLILDYRDPWTAYPSVKRARGGWKRAGWSHAVASSLERACVEQSSARVFNTEEMKVFFEEYFPQADPRRNFVIPNGLRLPKEDPRTAPATSRDIVHAGAIYGDRSLLPVLRALAAIIQNDPGFSDVRLVQYGDLLPAERNGHPGGEVATPACREIANSARSLWPVLRAGRVLLVVSGREMNYSIPYKLYDYLTAGRPILALAPTGSAVARMFSESRIGAYVDPKEENQLRAALGSLLEGKTQAPDKQVLDRHLWSNLAMEYREIIDVVLSQQERRPSYRI